jgi:hypothetical protein
MTNEIAAVAGLMTGFPPRAQSRVTLANWQDPQHAGYLLDTLRACAALAARMAVPGR